MHTRVSVQICGNMVDVSIAGGVLLFWGMRNRKYMNARAFLYVCCVSFSLLVRAFGHRHKFKRVTVCVWKEHAQCLIAEYTSRSGEEVTRNRCHLVLPFLSCFFLSFSLLFIFYFFFIDLSTVNISIKTKEGRVLSSRALRVICSEVS